MSNIVKNSSSIEPSIASPLTNPIPSKTSWWKNENPQGDVVLYAKDDPSFKKNLEETIRVRNNFKDKTANYPKRISHEASTVLCVLLSMNANPTITLSALPSVDQQMFRDTVPKNITENLDNISVMFDDNKDFIITFTSKTSDMKSEPSIFLVNVFNEIIHPGMMNKLQVDIPVDFSGDKIDVGGLITLDKKVIQRLGGIESKEDKSDPHLYKSKQPVSGRNAFEIRTDVLSMALEWSIYNKQIGSDEGVINVAKKFYSFVENRR